MQKEERTKMEQNNETIQLLRQIQESTQRSATYSVLQMEYNSDTSQFLTKIEKNSRRNAIFNMIQMIMTTITAICCVVVLFTALSLVGQIDGILTQAEAMMTNLEQVSAELNSVDLDGIVKDLDELFVSGREFLDQTKKAMGIFNFQ